MGQSSQGLRRRQTLALGTAAVLLFGLGTAPNASAAFVGSKLGSSNFEIDTDANLKVDGSAPSIDWLNSAGTALRVTPAQDKPTGGGDDSFGQGTSENDAVPTVTDGSIPPNKSDLKYFGVMQERTLTGSYLHLFWTRVLNPTGTTNMDFEFNRSTTLSGNGITPVRTAGDLLITYDLSNGGTNAVLSKRTWLATGTWSAAIALAGNAIGSINTTAITAANSGVVGPLTSRTFGEATIDLSLVFPSGQCTSFGSAYLKSRSSDSFSAAIKDFIAPTGVNVSNCASVAIHKQDDAGTALSGAGFTLYTNLAPLTGPRQITDLATPLTCSTLSAGDCTISDVPYGDYWVVETTTPANHDTAADQAINVASSGNTPSGTLTFVDPRLQGSIIVSKTDAFSSPLAGAGFTVNPGSHVMTEGATGVFCVDGLTYGGYTITESTVPFGYTGGSDQTFSVSTKSTCAARLAAAYTPDKTFVNSSKPGTINVLKTDDAAIGNPIAGAGFTLYQDIDAVGTYQPLVDTTKQAGPTSTSAEGVLQFGSVPIGDYCVVETFTPTGYATAPAQCVTIHLATDGETLNLTFVDPRQHKVIVIVCHEGTNTLDSSPVTLGTTKSSLASPPLGITEAQLCGLGGASFGGLSHGSSVPSVSVQ